MTIKRVLIFGFSVTEQNGYARVLASRLRAQVPDIEVSICGIGGMHPPESVYLFDSIVPRGKFDVIILELMTTGFRFGGGTAQACGLALLQLAAKSLRRSAYVIVLNLPRSDVDYSTDFFTIVARKISDALSLYFLDLASIITKAWIAENLVDEVHTNEVSASAYADMIEPHVLNCLQQPPQLTPRSIISVAEKAQSATAANLIPFADIIELNRSFNPAGIKIEGGSSIEIVMHAPTLIAGLTYFMGPRTGQMEVHFEDGCCISILAYDAFCYFNRLHGFLFPKSIESRRMRVSQSATLPNIKLEKGEANQDVRLGAIAHVLIDTNPQDDLVVEWSHLWKI